MVQPAPRRGSCAAAWRRQGAPRAAGAGGAPAPPRLAARLRVAGGPLLLPPCPPSRPGGGAGKAEALGRRRRTRVKLQAEEGAAARKAEAEALTEAAAKLKANEEAAEVKEAGFSARNCVIGCRSLGATSLMGPRAWR